MDQNENTNITKNENQEYIDHLEQIYNTELNINVSDDIQHQPQDIKQPINHFDIGSKLSHDEFKECLQKSEEEIEKDHNTREINLAKTSNHLQVPGQQFALVSFIGKNLPQKCEGLGMKIHGTFDTIENTKQFAQYLHKSEENMYFDLYILEMYGWASIPPDDKCIQDKEYHSEKLNEMIKEHKKQKILSDQIFGTRKKKLQENPDKNVYDIKNTVLKKLKDDPRILSDDISENEYKKWDENKIENKKTYLEVFGYPEKLPDFEVTTTPKEKK